MFSYPHVLLSQGWRIKGWTYLITDESHPAIMRPTEGCNWSVSIINQLYAPSSFILDPDKDDSCWVTWSQFLIWFIPFHHGYLKQKFIFNIIKSNIFWKCFSCLPIMYWCWWSRFMLAELHQRMILISYAGYEQVWFLQTVCGGIYVIV